jgi:N-formylglutamate amidohydrolase
MKPIFFSIPHSGERVPDEAHWLHGLPEPILMCDVDRFVDRLYAPAMKSASLTCIVTQWHRYVVDLNRLPGDVDADSVDDSKNPSGTFTTGLHWVKTTRGTRLMPVPMTRQLHDQLVKRYFEPFHTDIKAAYADFRKTGAKKIFHVDAHSMPSKGTSAHKDPGQTRADVVISDQEGKSCEPAFKDLVIKAYQDTGLKVAYNWPYVGGRVTQTYGKPAEGQHTIQVELNRALYMDEESKQWLPEKANQLMPKLQKAVSSIYEHLVI